MKLALLIAYIVTILTGSFLGTVVFAGGIATYMCGFVAGTISFVFLRNFLDY